MSKPPKKKQCLKTKQRKYRQNSQRRRQEENPEDRQARQEQNRSAMARSREMETPEERQARQEQNRSTMARSREMETPEERQTRQEQNRSAMARSREMETPEERQTRQEQNRSAMARSKEMETPEERQTRQEQNRSAMARSREMETPEEHQIRLEQNRSAIKRRRVLESDVQRQCRLEQQRNARLRLWRDKENAAFFYDPLLNYSADASFVIGRMSIVCQFCGVLKWKTEAPGMCCSAGKVKLPLLTDPPQPLRALLDGNSTDANHFRNNIRRYNSCFQMTSFGTTKEIREPGYMPTFMIQGQIYHLIGSLFPEDNEQPKFLQVYFTGNDVEQAEHRCRNVPHVKQELVLQLQEMLHQENSYIRDLKAAIEKVTPEAKIIISADRTPHGEHSGRFNAPTSSSEVAVIMAGYIHGPRDIIIETKSNRVQRLADTHRSYDALQYPLLFWQGEDGYHFELRQTNPSSGMPTTKKVTAMDFYAYRIMVHPSTFNIILRSKQLFHQYIVDMYVKIESERLRYIRLNQKKLRVEDYVHLRDAVINDGNVSDVGQLIILPSTFTGSPRYMHERTQDAMTYVQNYGRPDIFITVTCNPKWEEIKRELFPGQKPEDRHDLLARVFHLKLKNLMNLITKSKIFGSVRCYMYTVEWQKRGLPHAHILVWLQESLYVHRVDNFISAEIPNPDEDPELFNCIRTQMVHGPCGAFNSRSPCMKDGKCTKRYPRPFLKETRMGRDSYPLYRRRSPEDGGFTASINLRGSDVHIDNRWIVPYCPLLSRIFNAHINVEYCSSIKSIKYVCKYVNKGSDMSIFNLTSTNENCQNEVQQYEIGRYVSSNEAVWRILNFPIHERHPTVVHLTVHLENGQRVYFTEENITERAQVPQETTLTAFFKLCMEDEFACTLLYSQIPKYYTWNKQAKKWNRRKVGQTHLEHAGIKFSDALGRVYTVHPNNSECFHLRLLLHEVRGPKSFQDLRTVEGRICNTYKEACLQRGLLENDEHWNATLEEAAIVQHPKMLRDLFAIMLQMCAMSNPHQLWMNHKEKLSEDILHQARIQYQNTELDYSDAIFNRALINIEDKVKFLGGSTLEVFGLPRPSRDDIVETEMSSELNYNIDELTIYLEENENKMVEDQREAFDKITKAIFDESGGIFFLDAPGGTGKTFLLNLLLAKVRQRKKIALAVASSGIAATLLAGGRTAHSAFKLPLNMVSTDTPTCNISRRSERAKILKACKLIIWDECTMAHKSALEALDATMQDIRHSNKRMGGVTLVLAGDFRQTLPVIPRGTRYDEINACLKSSYMWSEIERLRLTTNMRVHLTGDSSSQQFAENLLKIGNGSFSPNAQDGCISLENIGTVVNSYKELLQAVFPNIQYCFKDHVWMCQRTILAPKNETVYIINKELLAQIPGNLQVYKSVDTMCEVNEAVNYPTEFLNSLEPPGMPSHILELKIGAPVVVLRNLDPPALCNGTRLIIKNLMPSVIEATILTGQAAGKDVFIPRIPIIPSDMPFRFRRLQFPIRLSFAMSINKAQGQSLKVVGLQLQNPCFTHGQLYVGCSRVGSSKNLYIFSPGGKTLNIVYPEVL